MIISTALRAVKALYSIVKTYAKASDEAKNLTERLEILQRILNAVEEQKVSQQHPIQDSLEHVKHAIDKHYPTIRFQLKQTISWISQARIVVVSGATKKALEDASWEIHQATSMLNLALTIQNSQVTHQVYDLIRAERGAHDAKLKQILAFIYQATAGEHVEDGSARADSIDQTNRTAPKSPWFDVLSSSKSLRMVPRISWCDLEWPYGGCPTRDNPNCSMLRKGGFGWVYKAALQQVGDVAVKVLDVDSTELQGKRFEAFKRECLLQYRVSTHPHVVSFFGFLYEASIVGLVMNLAEGGSLFSALNEEANDNWVRLPTPRKMKALKGVVAAVAFMHSVGLVHGDLKPQNVLLARQMTNSVKPPTFWVSDFGLSQTTSSISLSKGSTFNLSEANSDGGVAGTVGFMAPETALDSKTSKKSDVFSLAITIWAALSCREPFHGVTNLQQYSLQVEQRGRRPDLTLLPQGIPEEFKELVQACWDLDPEKRPSAVSVLDQWERKISRVRSNESESESLTMSLQGPVKSIAKQVSDHTLESKQERNISHKSLGKATHDRSKDLTSIPAPRIWRRLICWAIAVLVCCLAAVINHNWASKSDEIVSLSLGLWRYHVTVSQSAWDRAFKCESGYQLPTSISGSSTMTRSISGTPNVTTATPSQSRTATPSQSRSVTPSVSGTPNPSPSQSRTVTPSVSGTPNLSPSQSRTVTPSVSGTPNPTIPVRPRGKKTTTGKVDSEFLEGGYWTFQILRSFVVVSCIAATTLVILACFGYAKQSRFWLKTILGNGLCVSIMTAGSIVSFPIFVSQNSNVDAVSTGYAPMLIAFSMSLLGTAVIFSQFFYKKHRNFLPCLQRTGAASEQEGYVSLDETAQVLLPESGF